MRRGIFAGTAFFEVKDYSGDLCLSSPPEAPDCSWMEHTLMPTLTLESKATVTFFTP